MDDKKKEELVETFKKEGLKACLKKIDKKNDHERGFCEDLWLEGLLAEYTAEAREESE